MPHFPRTAQLTPGSEVRIQGIWSCIKLLTPLLSSTKPFSPTIPVQRQRPDSFLDALIASFSPCFFAEVIFVF